MSRRLWIGLLALALAGPAWAQDSVDEIPYEDDAGPRRGPAATGDASTGGRSMRGRVAAQGFLVDGKAIGGLVLGGAYGAFRFDLGLNLAWATDERAKATLDGDGFFGMVIDLHVGARIPLGDLLALEFATGADTWWLFALHSEEAKVGMPVVAAVEGNFANRLFARLEGRSYLLSSAGLMVGRKWEGGDTVPFFLTASAGVWF